MDLKIEKKIALVTGSTAGIGLAIGAELAREGATVYINGRSEARVNEALTKIRKMDIKGDVRGIVADAATKEGALKITSQIPQLDILVNNLGIYEVKPFEEITDEDWLRIFEINVLSGIRLSRTYLPLMKAQNWGRIIFISSESAVNVPKEMIHYGVTKTAQISLARGLAETTSGTGVTVNSVLPGPTLSEGVEKYIEQVATSRGIETQAAEQEFFKNIRPSSLIQRFATSEEVAHLVTYLASPLSSATNGAAVRVDGGVLRSII